MHGVPASRNLVFQSPASPEKDHKPNPADIGASDSVSLTQESRLPKAQVPGSQNWVSTGLGKGENIRRLR